MGRRRCTVLDETQHKDEPVDGRDLLRALSPRGLGVTAMHFVAIPVVILMLVAIAVPNFIHTHCGSPTKACIANLKQIDSAKEQYAMDHHLKDGDAIPSGVLWAPDGYLKAEPTCPKDGNPYIIERIGTDPLCSLACAHSLVDFDALVKQGRP
jgi:competence protein ComGC